MFPIRDSQTGKTKLAGRSKAIVIDTRDPLQRGRIRVDHPQIGDTTWIDYLRSPSTFNVPQIGDYVYIECDSGIDTHPVASGNKTQGDDNNPNIPASFRRSVPTNRGLYSPGGHKIELDDGIAPLTQTPQDSNYTTQNRGIKITSAAGNKVHILEDVDSDNTYILLEDSGGNLIKLDYKNNRLTINSIGNTVVNTTTDHQETIGGNLQISVSGMANINVTGEAIIDASVIKLNGSTGNILTTETDPVVDLIYGSATIGTTKVKAGI